jgi:hypothetical protein
MMLKLDRTKVDVRNSSVPARVRYKSLKGNEIESLGDADLGDSMPNK